MDTDPRPTNIGPRGRRTRALFGVVSFAGAAAVAAWLIAGDAARGWLLLVFALAWLGFLGVLQASGST